MTTATTDRLTTALAGRYRIERHLGEGGMAAVYLASDLRHDRRVALKVLKPELAAVLGADRFLQEIRTVANLQHPHILPLFDSGTADGFLYYVMPFIDGETLRAKLNRETQLGIEQAVRIAREVAEALDYAHRHGVIHRDIKPENILLQDGRPVVADFGIALAISAAAGGRMTETGLSLGTPHYMSPEQATAERALTSRSDVYSLGVVLYEMLTGDPPHTGNSAQQIIMKIITDPARPVTQLRKSVPPHVAAALAKSLEKLAADRFETAKAFGDALGDPAFAMGRARPTVGDAVRLLPGAGSAAWRFAVAGLLVIVGVAVGAAADRWLNRQAAASDTWPTHLRLTFPDSGFTPTFPAVAISPNGRFVAYRVGLPSGYSLRVADLTQPLSRPVAGSERSVATMWMMFSPDSRWLAFTAGRDVMRSPIDGGPATVLMRGLPLATPVWITEDELIGADSSGSLIRLSITNGNRTRLTIADSGTRHRFPVVGVDSKHVIFTIEGNGSNQLAVADVGRTGFTTLGVSAPRALGVIDGRLLYLGHDYSLNAVGVDLSRRRLVGAAQPVLPDIANSPQSAAVAPNGTLVLVPDARDWTIVSVNSRGDETVVDGETRNSLFPRLSPGERRLAFHVRDRVASASDIWIRDHGTGTVTRLTTGGGTAPEWSADGRYVFFVSNRSGRNEVWRQRADLSGSAEQLTRDSWKQGGDVGEVVVSPNGRNLLLRLVASGGGDLYWRSIDGDGTLRPFVQSPFDDLNPRFSPDGRLVAYSSNESGEYEVYVKPFPGPGPKVQVSVGGGRVPLWSPNGHTLYYRRIKETVAVDVRTSGTLSASSPRRILPSRPYRTASLGHQDFDVTSDGGFIFMKPVTPQGIEVILNVALKLRGAPLR